MAFDLVGMERVNQKGTRGRLTAIEANRLRLCGSFFCVVVVVDKNMSAMHRYVHTFFVVDWGGRFLVELRCHLNDEAMRDAFRREILECL